MSPLIQEEDGHRLHHGDTGSPFGVSSPVFASTPNTLTIAAFLVAHDEPLVADRR